MTYIPKHLKKWTYPENYFGSSFNEYYRAGVGQSRDSGMLERANFQAMLVERAGHWAVGWVESILILETDEKSLKIADDIMADFDDYPVIDEMLYSEMEYEAACEYADQSKGDLAQVLVNLFGLPEEMADEKNMLSLCYRMQVEYQLDNGEDSSLPTNQYHVDKMSERDLDRLKRALRTVEHNDDNPARKMLLAAFNIKKEA